MHISRLVDRASNRTTLLLCSAVFLALGCARNDAPSTFFAKTYSASDVSRLASDLKSHHASVQDEAVRGLIEVGPPSVPAVIDLLREYADSSDPLSGGLSKGDQSHQIGVRLRVQLILTRIGAPAVPALRELLKDQSRWRRFEAASVLGSLGPDGKDASADLRAALNDPDSWVRLRIAAAAWEVDPANAEAVGPVLERMAADQSDRERASAARLLDKIKSAAAKK